jgi:hypothetical protein
VIASISDYEHNSGPKLLPSVAPLVSFATPHVHPPRIIKKKTEGMSCNGINFFNHNAVKIVLPSGVGNREKQAH